MKAHQSLSKVLVSVLVVRLEFDGSLRPPKDFGFPTIPATLATCSASLSIATDSSDASENVVLSALGCRWLPSSLGMTSAHAEYGGLLLGVEFLNELDSNDLFFSKKTGKYPRSLLIRGDCKTVIDQMNGKSVPRRMESMHRKVVDLLSQMEHKFDSVKSQHVTRENNALCDSLCGNLMNVIEWQEVEACRKAIYESRDRQTTTTSIDVYASYLKDEATCRIPYSKRPDLYEGIAALCKQLDDFETLIEVGERRLKESALTENEHMAAQGIRNQIDGWRGLGAIKKVDHLIRKHRYLLAKYETPLYYDSIPESAASLDGTPIEWNTELLEKHSCLEQDLLEVFGRTAMTKTWYEGSTLWVTPSYQNGVREKYSDWPDS